MGGQALGWQLDLNTACVTTPPLHLVPSRCVSMEPFPNEMQEHTDKVSISSDWTEFSQDVFVPIVHCVQRVKKPLF